MIGRIVNAGYGSAVAICVAIALYLLLLAVAKMLPPPSPKPIDVTERQILADPTRGPAEVRRRLQTKIKVQSGFAAVQPYLSTDDVQVIPTSTPWTIRCNDGYGLVIAFMPDVTAETGGLLVQIAPVRASADECVAMSLMAATALRELLAER